MTTRRLLNPHFGWRVEPRSRWRDLRRSFTPERLLVVSFASLIALGTVGFMVLPGLYVSEPLGWLDALFTATSAVCITGLIVVDTATYFTSAGQAYLLLLIQLGGLGIITLTTAVILALGRRLSLNHEAVTATGANVARAVDFRQLIRTVVWFTLAFEAVGAVILFFAWLPRFEPGTALWHAVFQAVSAFCNAGFSTFSDSLVGFRSSPVSLVVLMVLIVLGGIGFVVLEDVRVWWTSRRTGSTERLSLHTRLALTVTSVLLIGGAAGFAALEWTNQLTGLPAWARVLNALFMSATARTAGFNTVDHAAAGDGTNFLTILLMSVGGSPGSAAGGLKTTTVAVISLLAVARLRGHLTASAWSRTIPEETIQRAIGLFVVGFSLVAGAILFYVVTQPGAGDGNTPLGFLDYMFEAVSAFNTVGLSMGATGTLDSGGKSLTILLMYLGRVGPLAFVAAISRRAVTQTPRFRFAQEDVIIG